MQAVKGLFIDGRFIPINKTTLPRQVHAILLFEETPMPSTNKAQNFWLEFDNLADVVKEEESQTRTAWLTRLRQARQQAEGEPLPVFPSRTPMKPPHGFTN
ncbi:MAG: hypothetical protein FWD90_05530 [Defluviitaleaceae bacterium]|nr:hypothetical protein [Defluviitaleaceae bacterium]